MWIVVSAQLPAELQARFPSLNDDWEEQVTRTEEARYVEREGQMAMPTRNQVTTRC